MSFTGYNRWYHSWLWKDEEDSGYDGSVVSFTGDDMEEAYNAGTHYFEVNQGTLDKLTQENDALKELLKANVRVMKAEIKKEMDEDGLRRSSQPEPQTI